MDSTYPMLREAGEKLEATEQQLDRLLRAVQRHCEIQGGADYETPDRDLYEVAEEIRKEKNDAAP